MPELVAPIIFYFNIKTGLSGFVWMDVAILAIKQVKYKNVLMLLTMQVQHLTGVASFYY